MTIRHERFECVMEPTGAWMVWDKIREMPAELSDIVLIGLRRRTAESFRDILNGTPPQIKHALAS